MNEQRQHEMAQALIAELARVSREDDTADDACVALIALVSDLCQLNGVDPVGYLRAMADQAEACIAGENPKKTVYS
jgi:hypothetical protein